MLRWISRHRRLTLSAGTGAQLGELVAAASDDGAKAENAAAKDNSSGRSGTSPRRQPARAPLPDHLPRERVVLPSPTAYPCCGRRLVKLGEDVTDTLEVVPRQWKVIRMHPVNAAALVTRRFLASVELFRLPARLR